MPFWAANLQIRTPDPVACSHYPLSRHLARPIGSLVVQQLNKRSKRAVACCLGSKASRGDVARQSGAEAQLEDRSHNLRKPIFTWISTGVAACRAIRPRNVGDTMRSYCRGELREERHSRSGPNREALAQSITDRWTHHHRLRGWER